MPLFQRKTPLEKEWLLLQKREASFLRRQEQKKENILTMKLSKKIPAKLQQTLDTAFYQAFALIFAKGTHIIEKTYKAEERKKNFQINDYADDVRQSRKSLRAFGKQANAAGTGNMLLSGAAGIGMGLMGVGIPDIPVFTSLLLKNIYEISLSYGYDYKLPQEQYFILLLIEAAVSCGQQSRSLNEEINRCIRWGTLPEVEDLTPQIRKTADALAKDLLYMKFLQGIPVVGAIGGAYDAVTMGHVSDYAKLKYQRRLLERKKKEFELR